MSERNRNDMHEAVNNPDKALYFFANEDDAAAVVAGDRSALSKKIAMQSFTHPRSLGLGGLKAIDATKVVAGGTMIPVFVVCLDNLGEPDVTVDDAWGSDAPKQSASSSRRGAW